MTLKRYISRSPVCEEEEKMRRACTQRREQWCRAVALKLYTLCINLENIRLSKYNYYDPCKIAEVELGNPVQLNAVQTGVRVIPNRNCIYC